MMRKFFGFFANKEKCKSLPLFLRHRYFYRSVDTQKFKIASTQIQLNLQKIDYSIDQINEILANNIRNQKNSEFWKESENSSKLIKSFEEIDLFNRNLLEEMSLFGNFEKAKFFSLLIPEMKKDEIFKIVSNRLFRLIHSHLPSMLSGTITYEMKMKLLAISINFFSTMVYLKQDFSSKDLEVFSQILKLFLINHGLMEFKNQEKYAKIHELLKENVLDLLKDNLTVYCQKRYHFLSGLPVFGELVNQMNENLFGFDDQIRLSEVFLQYLKENLIFLSSDVPKSSKRDLINERLFNVCLKDKSSFLEENPQKNVEKAPREKKMTLSLSEYFIMTFGHISEYFVYYLNERKSISKIADLLTVIEVVKIHEAEPNYASLNYYLQEYCKVQENDNSRKLTEKIGFLIDALEILSSDLSETEEKSPQIVSLFEKAYSFLLMNIENPMFNPKANKQNIVKIFKIFLETRILSLELLLKAEEKVASLIHEVSSFYEFFQIILFYTQAPKGIAPPRNLAQNFLYYIKMNFDLFNTESLLSIGLAVLQLGYNRKSERYDLFNFIDQELWGKLMNKLIQNIEPKNLSRSKIFKFFMFLKFVNYDPALKNETFDQLIEKFKQEFASFEVRTISIIQHRFEKMLESKKMTYLMEPPLIDDIFSVDFLVKYKKDKLIAEINGPVHYFTVLWKPGEDMDTGVKEKLEKMEKNSEFFDKKGMAVVESRYTSLKKDFLERLGFNVVNISFIDMKNYEGKDQLFEYFLDLAEIKNKGRVRKNEFN